MKVKLAFFFYIGTKQDKNSKNEARIWLNLVHLFIYRRQNVKWYGAMFLCVHSSVKKSINKARVVKPRIHVPHDERKMLVISQDRR